MASPADPVSAFIVAACAPRDAWHSSGTLDEANAILAEHPEVATSNIFTAAILGDEAAVKQFLALNPASATANGGSATAKGGPHNWDPLTYLCFSRYLRLDPARSDGLVRSATALLDAGASPNTGWFEEEHEPKPVWESALYGAAGVAHHAELTRLLLARGANPNDDETPYHAPEMCDLAVVEALVESGRLTQDSLSCMLLRKADWHDYDGMKYLLEHGADPKHVTWWGCTGLDAAVIRDNDLENIRLMLDHGADPTTKNREDGRSALQTAARRGRSDVLAEFERRGIPIELDGVDRLIAACARDDTSSVRAIAKQEPDLVRELVGQGGKLLAEFAGVGNTAGVGHLLDLGVEVAARYEGDGYFCIAKDSTALHVAAWRARPSTVNLLIQRGAPVDARDAEGRTPLAMAVKACVDSYWTERRTPESVETLLRAGASTAGVPYPCGYAEVDALLAQRVNPAL